jgi:hypothetical protein
MDERETVPDRWLPKEVKTIRAASGNFPVLVSNAPRWWDGFFQSFARDWSLAIDTRVVETGNEARTSLV